MTITKIFSYRLPTTQSTVAVFLLAGVIFFQGWVDAAPLGAYVTVGPADADFIVDGTNDQLEIQAALDLVNSKGGGTVFLRSNQYIISASIVRYSRTSLKGEQKGSTVLKLADGSTNFDVVLSDKFYDLSTTGSGDGITLSKISELTIDGNRENVQALATADEHRIPALIKTYGYFNELENVFLANAKQTGIYNEWSRSRRGSQPVKDDRWYNVEVVDYEHIGIVYRGPSDAMWVTVYASSQKGPKHHVLIQARQDSSGDYDGSSVVFNDLHVFGNATDHAIKIEGDGTIFPTALGRIIEGGTQGAGKAAVYLNTDRSRLEILPYFADIGVIVAGRNNTLEVSNILEGAYSGVRQTLVQIGDSDFPIGATGNYIQIHAKNTPHAVDFKFSWGTNIIFGQHFFNKATFPDGSTIIGNRSSSDRYRIFRSEYGTGAGPAGIEEHNWGSF